MVANVTISKVQKVEMSSSVVESQQVIKNVTKRYSIIYKMFRREIHQLMLFLLLISLPRILHVPKVVLHQERVREIVLLFLKKEQIGENAHLLVQRLLGKGVIMIKIVQKPNVVLIIALMSMELLAPMLRKH